MTQKTQILHEAKREFGMMGFEIDNIFQSRNPHFYIDATQMENQAAIFTMIFNAMEHAGVHFDATFNSEEPEVNEMWLASGEDGAFISHFTYMEEEKSDVPPAKKSVFFIGKFELNNTNEIHRVAPFYCLHGAVETPDDTNGKEVFFPLESGCRNRMKGQKSDSFCFASNSDEFVQMLCYAREAFKMILTEQIISVASLKHWIEPEKLEESFQEFGKIIATDSHEFEQMIAWDKATQIYKKSNPSFVGLSTPARN